MKYYNLGYNHLQVNYGRGLPQSQRLSVASSGDLARRGVGWMERPCSLRIQRHRVMRYVYPAEMILGLDTYRDWHRCS